MRVADVEKNQTSPKHELLGSRATDSNDTEIRWQNVLDTKDVPWLADHVVLGQVVFPAAAYIAMAAESMRQLSSGNLEFVALKDFSTTSALIVRPDEKVKLLTRLLPANVTKNTEQWYEIQVLSHDGSEWIERCISKVSPCGPPLSKDSIFQTPKDALPRQVTQGYWYDVVESNGIRYGPSFQGLDEISTSVTNNEAVATISSFGNPANSCVHPIIVDQCFQTLMVAACRGQGRQLGQLSVVTTIEYLAMSGTRWERLRIGAAAEKDQSGALIGNISGVSEKGHPILTVRSCKTSVISYSRQKSESKLFSFIKWDTDATYCDFDRALAPVHPQVDSSILLERFTLLRLLSAEKASGELGQAYLQKVQDAATSKKKGRWGIVDDITPYANLDSINRQTISDSLRAQLSSTEFSPFASVIDQLLASGAGCSGSSSRRLALLSQCNPLVRNNGALARIVKIFAHKNPKLKVLELGNGSNETTRLILKLLESQYGDRLYLTYTYAATSTEGAKSAQVSFKDVPDVNVVIFNVDKPLQGQSLQAGGYDLIITTDASLLSLCPIHR